MKNCKQYMVFEYVWRNPSGGLDDCEVSFDRAHEAVDYASESNMQIVIVFDRIEGTIIYKKENKTLGDRRNS